MGKLRLRAHHLEGIRQVLTESRDDFIAELIEHKYIDSPEAPFAGIYDFIRTIFSNPQQKFLIIDGQSDFVCDVCPINGRRASCPKFVGPPHKYMSGDRPQANKWDVELNFTYTSSQLIEKLSL